MLNTRSTNDEENVTPFSNMGPIDAHRTVTMLMIPTTNEVASSFNTTLEPKTTSQLFPHVFHSTSSDHYLTKKFLKSCFICRKDLGEMVDIFMYKDQSFCSDGCRNKQMDNDREEEIKNRDKIMNHKRSRKNSVPKGSKKAIFFFGDV